MIKLPTLTLRPATLHDLDALTTLAATTWRDAFGPTMPADEVAAHIATSLSRECVAEWLRDDVVLVAEGGGALLGYAHLSATTTLDPERAATSAELRRLYVLGSAQHRGIGSALLRAALAHPLVRDAGALFLQVWEANHGAQRLYERHGFTVVGSFRYRLPSGAAGDLEWVMRRGQTSDVRRQITETTRLNRLYAPRVPTAPVVPSTLQPHIP